MENKSYRISINTQANTKTFSIGRSNSSARMANISPSTKLIDWRICRERNLAPSTILDFGCGTGKNLKHLRKHFPKAVLFGTDISQDSLDIAAKLNLDSCKLDYFDGETLPYKAPMFDMILAVNVFHHIPFELHEGLLAGLRKTLNPDGVFVLFEQNPINPITRKIVRECPFDKDARLLKPSYRTNCCHKPLIPRRRFTM
ncbi:MAG: class I SAM-dependent methyltransferase [bacterium]|nr:class I SAM-dependent methyltransferase [bacterium]